MKEIEARLQKSRRYLEMAWHDYHGGFCEGAVSHAYYAMFHSAKAFLALDDISPKTHKGVILQLGKYVKLGKLGKDEVRSIAHGLTVRIRCDYDIEVVLDRGEVGELLNEAEHFVDKIEAVVADKSRETETTPTER
ncbi:MAG: HEPN domain-containing protein [Methanosarcinales archaeon]|nr:HEPN domain-containing protein [Methanosarcinales archaeon]